MVFELLKDPVFDRHITEVIAFERAPVLFDRLREGSVEGLGICLQY